MPRAPWILLLHCFTSSNLAAAVLGFLIFSEFEDLEPNQEMLDVVVTNKGGLLGRYSN